MKRWKGIFFLASMYTFHKCLLPADRVTAAKKKDVTFDMCDVFHTRYDVIKGSTE